MTHRYFAIQLERQHDVAGWLIYNANTAELVGYAQSNSRYLPDHALKLITQQLWTLATATEPVPPAQMMRGHGYECEWDGVTVRLDLLSVLEVAPKEVRAAKQHELQFKL